MKIFLAYEFVKLHQVHKRWISCRKYKNKLCRYGFSRFITERTIVSEPLEDNIKYIERYFIIKKRDTILSEFSDFINKFPNTSKDIFLKDLCVVGIENY